MNVLRTVKTLYRVSDFLTWQKSGSLELSPFFQRRAVWKKGAKSYLIDTMLRGLPIPIIFLRDKPGNLGTLKSVREVVDGQQRLRTIVSFVAPKLLSDFDPLRDGFTIDKNHNKQLAGQGFLELTNDLKQQILDYEFSVHSFPADTDDRLVLETFARMNSTGYKLNSQELRNAGYFGDFKTLAYSLAREQLTRWRQWKVFSPDQIARMQEVELTSEFLMLVTHGTLEKNSNNIDSYYERYNDEYPYAKEATRRFRVVFDELEDRFTVAEIATLFSTRTIFFALFATVYGLLFGLRSPVATSSSPRLERKKASPLKQSSVAHVIAAAKDIKDENISTKISKALRGATADASQRRTVIGFLAGPDDPCRHLS